MKIGLSFSLAQNETNKVADFPSVKLKDAYVEAEFRDLSCQKAYLEYQAAKTIAERKQKASVLDDMRHTFYRKWAKTHLPNPKFPTLPPVDDIA